MTRHNQRLAAGLVCALSLVSPARAETPCEDLQVQLGQAWDAFDDAEVELAEQIIDRARGDLSCQTRLLTTAELLDLYEFDALVSLANSDEDRAVYAIIRTVTTDPDGSPDPSLGPEVADLHNTWRRRLSAARLTLTVRGDTTVHVDGKPIKPGKTLSTLEGEHVLQWTDLDGVRTEVRELIGSQILTTSESEGLLLVPAPTVTEPAKVRPAKPKRPRTPGDRKPLPGTPAMWGTGLGLVAIGGGAILAGFFLEQDFQQRGADGNSSVSPDDLEATIRREAGTVNALYGAGYGLTGVGAVLTGVGFAVSPRSGGASVAVALRF